MKNFQLIVLVIFSVFIVIGVIFFATGGGSGSSPEADIEVTIWGTLDRTTVNKVVSLYNADSSDDDQVKMEYKEFDEDEFDSELIEALASSKGPDMILLSHESIVRHEDKIFTIPFESYTERDFKDSFIEEGELFLTDGGILALPFSVDPMVMYWNRTLFSNAGLALPPENWDELQSIVPLLTQRDSQNNILASAVALGEYGNIDHAQELLSALIMQSGDPIVIRDSEDKYDITLGNDFDYPEVPAEAALRFYTEFADPVKSLYSWNRSLPSSKDAFIAGDSAMYFGFASELGELVERNPNLNFDVAAFPQIRDTSVELTYGEMYGLAVMNATKSTTASFRAIGVLTNEELNLFWEEYTGLPPVRRSALSEEAVDAFKNLFRDSALISNAFLDLDKGKTEDIFQGMIEDVTSGRERVSDAVDLARNQLELLLP